MTAAETHLKRAYGLLSNVESQLEGFRSDIASYNAEVASDQPFLAGMVSSFQGGRRLSSQRAALKQDIDLAWSEINRAEQMDAGATLATGDDRYVDISLLRAMACLVSGELEIVGGTAAGAIDSLRRSLEYAETAHVHYLLGIVHGSEHRPIEALPHFERSLELEPDGEFAVAALREANAMRNYRKSFRGDWGTFGCLMLVFFPVGILYFVRKYK